MLSFLGLNRTIKRISFAFRFQNLCTSSAESFSYLDLSNQTPSSFTDISGGTEVGPFPANATPRNYFRGPGGFNVDLGVIKNFRFTERYNFQVRAEFINAFNMTNLQVVGTSADLSSGNVLATRVGSNGTPRTIQLSAKFNF